MQTWFARSERGRIQGTTHFFSRMALAITPFISGHILLAFGRRTIFYVFGSFGILWAIVFFTVYRNYPEDHPGVNQAELAEIRGLNADGTIKALDRSRPATPWKNILSSPNMWFIAFGYFCFFFGSNFYLTWYPTYLREYRHLTIQQLGLLGSLPLLIGMTGDVVGGWLTDRIYHKTGSARKARRWVAVPAFIMAGAFSIPAAMTSDTLTCLLCIAASFFSLEMVIGPAWAVPMDVGGQFSGTVTGIMNMMRRAGALRHGADLRLPVRQGNVGRSVPGFRRSHGAGSFNLVVPDRSRKVGRRGPLGARDSCAWLACTRCRKFDIVGEN